MRTLYEILEVSETASKEIIEKAYKVLAKKHHPDLQPESEKENAEKIMKQINEAYNILIDEAKRKAYDEELKAKRAAYNEELRAKREIENQQNSSYYNSYQNSQNINKEYKNAQQEMLKRQQEMQQNIQQQYEQKYQEAYEGYLKSLGYKIKYKWTWKNYRDFLITILIIIAICAILWLFPPTHNIIMNFYESNGLIKTIVQVIGKILQGIWNGICSIFTKTSNP